MFYVYFISHDSYSTMHRDELEALVNDRAQSCSLKYRQKLKQLQMSHADYYLDGLASPADQVEDADQSNLNCESMLKVSVV